MNWLYWRFSKTVELLGHAESAFRYEQVLRFATFEIRYKGTGVLVAELLKQ
jgi:hypothetical protein